MITIKNFLAGIGAIAVTSTVVSSDFAERFSCGVVMYIAFIMLADQISELYRLDKKIRRRIRNRKARRAATQTRINNNTIKQ